MSADSLLEQLERCAPGQWELYHKVAESREQRASAHSRRSAWRREEGWAARWWESGSPRFASASSCEQLGHAIAAARRLAINSAVSHDWPTGSSPVCEPGAVSEPPDLYESLRQLVSVESRGEAIAAELFVRRGSSSERIRNARGLDVSFRSSVLDGVASAIGRRGSRACEARVVFRWDREPELESLARRLCDRATLPLSDRPTPIARGEWLLDPSIAAAVLAAIAPLFSAEAPPAWMPRARFGSPLVTIIDDASADAPFDGEGTPTRRLVVVEKGALRARLHDLRSAHQSGQPPTGHGVRPSYRTPPSAGPRRLFFDNDNGTGTPPTELLASVRRGLFASALVAPVRVDLERDRYEVEFTGIAILGGRAQAPVGGARASGRLSEMLRRIAALSTDRQFFPMPYPAGAPTLLIERAEFE